VKGKAAVFNTLLEFRLTVRWELNGHNLELMLPGTTRTIAKSGSLTPYTEPAYTGTVDQAEFETLHRQALRIQLTVSSRHLSP